MNFCIFSFDFFIASISEIVISVSTVQSFPFRAMDSAFDSFPYTPIMAHRPEWPAETCAYQ